LSLGQCAGRPDAAVGVGGRRGSYLAACFTYPPPPETSLPKWHAVCGVP
jgi:hypothetical protein